MQQLIDRGLNAAMCGHSFYEREIPTGKVLCNFFKVKVVPLWQQLLP